MTKALVAEVAIQVPFHDLDPMEVVWHGNYAKYFEHARHALLRGLDYDYPQMKASGYAWPVIDLSVRYVKSAYFGQVLRVRAEIVAWENYLKIKYVVSDSTSGERLTKGSTTQVAVEIGSGEMQFVCPTILWQKLGKQP